MKISVIIVNYNVRYFLEQTLGSVYRALDYMNRERPEWEAEVIVVDNNSVDGSCTMVEEKFPSCRLIANKENVGFSRANNQGIQASSGAYVLLLNPDTVIEEATFDKVLSFMDEHPDAGGVGVKMVDGQGNFLPESKRGFPSPTVAFSKLFGLSKLFPRSPVFNYYHLGHLDKDQIHKVDVLSGAFMVLRRAALDKAGLLDESYFMYGEDIDLSWRIKEAGYENYYYPEVKIIHYKGESTKKSSINYVFVFYKAMIIFARRHLTKRQARIFSFLINIAIYLRAFASVISRFARKSALPLMDAAVLFAVMYALKVYWENTIKYIEGGAYPPELLYFNFPAYILLWMTGIFMYRCYKHPYNLWKIVKGVIWGTVMIAVFYAFIDEAYRFSRALIVLGAGGAVIVFSANRVFFHFIRERNLDLLQEERRQLVLVGEHEEIQRALDVLKETGLPFNFIGYVQPERSTNADDTNCLGTLEQLDEIVSIYRADEVVFCNKNLSASEIINQMIRLPGEVNYKIIPSDSGFAIGSNSKDHPGAYYAVDIDFRLNHPDNRFKKRVLDIVVALLLLLAYPILIWFVEEKKALFSNIFLVLAGRYTWVGIDVSPQESSLNMPESVKQGILSPAEHVSGNHVNEHTRKRLSFLYARDYRPYKDLEIIRKAFRHLGRSPGKV